MLETYSKYIENCEGTSYIFNNGASYIFVAGPPLPPDEIISSHKVEISAVEIKCYSLCKGEPRCVGFNYRATTIDVNNCQLTNVSKKRGHYNDRKLDIATRH